MCLSSDGKMRVSDVLKIGDAPHSFSPSKDGGN